MVILFFSKRMEIERLFYEWCEKNGIAKLPNALVSFMQANGWLNVEKIIDDLKSMEAGGNEAN